MTDKSLAQATFMSSAAMAGAASGQPLQMDPRLQRLLARWRSGATLEATASAQPGEVAVVAKVSSRAAWEELSEVRIPRAIGKWDKEERTTIVTGRIPVSRIQAVREMEFVISLKAAQPLKPTLSAGVRETNAAPDLLPPEMLSSGGEGVVVGIVDYGCDFAHLNFMIPPRASRLLTIWDQGGQTVPGSDVAYGREYRTADIEAVLTQADPYAALGYGPAVDTIRSVGTHGTHVMDIAAGNGFGSGAAGFAPNADLVFVDVSHDDIPFAGPEVVGSSFGDSVMLLEALDYIFEQAGTRPCVINVSLGTNGGPHDGSTLVEEGIDRMVSAEPNRAVTIAASNSFDDGIHASGTVPADGTVDLVWQVPFNDRSHNEFELWYPADDRITLELIKPDGGSLGTITPGNNGQLVDQNGDVQVFAANRVGDPNNGDNMIGIFLERTADFGSWTIRLHGTQIQSGQFHAWIERDNVTPSSFAPPHDNTHTVGSISCGQKSIVVGSYDAHKTSKPISWFSSAGPTRDGREKPEISAPGHAVMAAHSRTKSKVVSKNGTSMAAPAVAGIVALMMGEARLLGLELSVDTIREILIHCARRDPPSGSGWDDRHGFGRVDAARAVAEVRKLADGQPLVASLSSKKSAKGRKKKEKIVA